MASDDEAVADVYKFLLDQIDALKTGNVVFVAGLVPPAVFDVMTCRFKKRPFGRHKDAECEQTSTIIRNQRISASQ
jgi:hypothetical protein